ncbi:MAG: putative sulfate exporter family transporter [Jatrophihabitans sp.]|nr:MAG: putative sulfate exporter family transporter [Jatrophihabitans sp.]
MRTPTWTRPLPGAAAIIAVAGVATALGRLLPLVGAPVIALLLGAALGTTGVLGARFRPGLGLASGLGLKLAVVLLGAQLSLRQVAHAGLDSLPVMLGTLAVCLALAWLLGRWLGVGADLRTLIGVGTGICGASAIAAVTPVIKARGSDVAYAITTIFACNMLAVLLFPPLGHLLGLDQHAFGVFAGTAVNDTSSVVAAATTYGTVAAHDAVVVKLTRTLMIVPICIGLAALVRRREHEQTQGKAVWRLVPWFLPAFLAVVALNSVGAVPHVVGGALEKAAVFLITAALAAIGASVDLPGLRRAGSRPLLLGVLLWIAVATTSLGLQAV